MTKEQFIEIAATTSTPPPIMMADGRMGLCCHITDTEVLVDAYRDNECETVRVPFGNIADLGSGALLEFPAGAPACE